MSASEGIVRAVGAVDPLTLLESRVQANIAFCSYKYMLEVPLEPHTLFATNSIVKAFLHYCKCKLRYRSPVLVGKSVKESQLGTSVRELTAEIQTMVRSYQVQLISDRNKEEQSLLSEKERRLIAIQQSIQDFVTKYKFNVDMQPISLEFNSLMPIKHHQAQMIFEGGLIERDIKDLAAAKTEAEQLQICLRIRIAQNSLVEKGFKVNAEREAYWNREMTKPIIAMLSKAQENLSQALRKPEAEAGDFENYKAAIALCKHLSEDGWLKGGENHELRKLYDELSGQIRPFCEFLMKPLLRDCANREADLEAQLKNATQEMNVVEQEINYIQSQIAKEDKLIEKLKKLKLIPPSSNKSLSQEYARKILSNIESMLARLEQRWNQEWERCQTSKQEQQSKIDGLEEDLLRNKDFSRQELQAWLVGLHRAYGKKCDLLARNPQMEEQLKLTEKRKMRIEQWLKQTEVAAFDSVGEQRKAKNDAFDFAASLFKEGPEPFVLRLKEGLTDAEQGECLDLLANTIVERSPGHLQGNMENVVRSFRAAQSEKQESQSWFGTVVSYVMSSFTIADQEQLLRNLWNARTYKSSRLSKQTQNIEKERAKLASITNEHVVTIEKRIAVIKKVQEILISFSDNVDAYRQELIRLNPQLIDTKAQIAKLEMHLNAVCEIERDAREHIAKVTSDVQPFLSEFQQKLAAVA